MSYENLPRVTATYNEVGLVTPIVSGQPEILVLGPCRGGRSYEKFFVGNVAQAARLFGRQSPVIRGVYEALSEGADNISLMKVGGRRATVVLTGDDGSTLTVSPWDRGSAILEQFVLVVQATEQRILIWDKDNDVWVYDSDEVFVADEGAMDIEMSADFEFGFDLFGSVDLTQMSAEYASGNLKTLAEVLDTDGTDLAHVEQVAGDDGLSPSLVERYAGLATAYHLLNFQDCDIALPVDVYIDAPNVADDDSSDDYGCYWAGRTDAVSVPGLPEAGAENDKLGYVWHAIVQGMLYTYFTDTADYFDVTPASASFTDGTLQLTMEAGFEGKGGNACTYEREVGAASGGAIDVTVTPNMHGGVDIHVVADEDVETQNLASAISSALATVELPGGLDYSDVIFAIGDSAVTGDTPVAKTHFTGGAGGHVLTHQQLTGDMVPAKVSTLWSQASDVQLRETNFAHQLATFCELSSRIWKGIVGVIGVQRPSGGLSRLQLSSWVGDLPEYRTDGRVQWVPSGGNGTGLLGQKLLAGKSGYRSHVPGTGLSSDGAAGGGLILTRGSGLATVGGSLGRGFPYGIADGDEALDENDAPVDIGKYLLVTHEWPLLSNGWSQGRQYRGSFAGNLAGMVARTPTNKLMIGQFGVTASARGPLKIHPTQLDALARIRSIGIKADEQFGLTLTSSQTAANPASDYAKLSTIRCVNAVVNTLREIAKPFLGRPYSPTVLASLQQAIDGTLANLRGGENGLHEGAVAQLVYTRRDRILGSLEIRLRMVPPFGIRDILVSTSLAADESEI